MAQAPHRRDQRGDQRVPQRRHIKTGFNRFDISDYEIPDHMTYEWKRESLFGQIDQNHQSTLEYNGWTPVPSERHKEQLGSRATSSATIRESGQILMERPKEITDQVRVMEDDAARGQVRDQLKSLGLRGHRAAGRGIKTTYDAVPEDE